MKHCTAFRAHFDAHGVAETLKAKQLATHARATSAHRMDCEQLSPRKAATSGLLHGPVFTSKHLQDKNEKIRNLVGEHGDGGGGGNQTRMHPKSTARTASTGNMCPTCLSIQMFVSGAILKRYGCAACGASKKGERWHCALCDYNLCHDCHASKWDASRSHELFEDVKVLSSLRSNLLISGPLALRHQTRKFRTGEVLFN